MLRQIISLFQDRKIINLSDLAIHFKTDKSAMAGMLLHLINANYIEHINTECSSCSSNCKTCGFAEEKEYYKLTDK
jgi:hypothetical protein